MPLCFYNRHNGTVVQCCNKDFCLPCTHPWSSTIGLAGPPCQENRCVTWPEPSSWEIGERLLCEAWDFPDYPATLVSRQLGTAHRLCEPATQFFFVRQLGTAHRLCEPATCPSRASPFFPLLASGEVDRLIGTPGVMWWTGLEHPGWQGTVREDCSL